MNDDMTFDDLQDDSPHGHHPQDKVQKSQNPLSHQREQTRFFSFDEEEDDDVDFEEEDDENENDNGQGQEPLHLHASPFQVSEPLPVASANHGQSGQLPLSSAAKAPKKRFPLVRLLLLAGIAVAIIFTGILVSLPLTAAHTPVVPSSSLSTRPTQIVQPTLRPTSSVLPITNGTPAPSGATVLSGSWLPQQLPADWTQANLGIGDALFAERTAVAFTDREMSLDYRSVGTRGQHAGTFTSAVFLLTSAAKTRFAQNDVRVVDNELFDTVQQEQLIQSVINPQPSLVQFSTLQGQQFIWVTVSFQLWQSKITVSETRMESLEVVSKTNQPFLHHMSVLLVHVPQNQEGPSPAMGGTGWLVSTYALDQTNLPASIQPA